MPLVLTSDNSGDRWFFEGLVVVMVMKRLSRIFVEKFGKVRPARQFGEANGRQLTQAGSASSRRPKIRG